MFPILNIYASPIPSFGFAEAGVLFTICIYIMLGGSIMLAFRKWKILLLLLVYMLTVQLYHQSLNLNKFSHNWMVLLQNIYYVFIFICISDKIYLRELGFKIVLFMSILSSLYIYIQYIFYYVFDTILLGYMRTLPLHIPEYARSYNEYFSYLFRPASIFYEPSHFAQYAVLGLVISLWYLRLKIKFFYALIIASAMILSTSFTGIVLVIFVYILYIWKNTKLKTKIVGSAALVLVFLLLFNFVPFFNVSIRRALTTDVSQNAFWARNTFLLHNKEMYLNIIGYSNVDHITYYLTSFSYLFIYYGIVSLLLVLMFYISLYRKGLSDMEKILLIVASLIFLSCYGFNSYLFLFYYSFIISGKKAYIV